MTDAEYYGLVERTCQQCGRIEDVAESVIAYAEKQGFSDEWLCWDCALELEAAKPEAKP